MYPTDPSAANPEVTQVLSYLVTLEKSQKAHSGLSNIKQLYAGTRSCPWPIQSGPWELIPDVGSATKAVSTTFWDVKYGHWFDTSR